MRIRDETLDHWPIDPLEFRCWTGNATQLDLMAAWTVPWLEDLRKNTWFGSIT